MLKLLVATKFDDEEHRQVSSDQADAFAKEHGLKIFYTSAHSGLNVNESFDHIARMAIEQQAASLMQR